MINPTFTWFVNDTVKSISGSIFDYSFSSVGNHKVKVIATFDNTTITKSIIVSVIDLPVTDVYNLSIVNNKVLFTISGIDDLNRTANISNGIFETINYSAFTGSKLETVKNSDFVMSFEIDHSFDPGDEKMINLAIKIVDSQNRSLVAIIKNLRLFYSNNKLYIDANSNINTKLYGYGKTSNGTPLSTEISNIDFSRIISTTDNETIYLNHTKLINEIYNSVSNGSKIANKFFTQAGTYNLSFYISNLDNFTGFTTSSNTDISSGFNGHLKNNIEDEFSNSVFKLSGIIKVQ